MTGTNNSIYNEYSNPYDRILLSWKPYLDLRNLHLSSSENASFVLDAGAGTGNVSVELIKDKKKKVWAIDKNKSMLDYMRNKLPKNNPRLEIQEMDMECLDLPNEFFDFINSMNVLYNASNPNKALQESYRVLKKDGLISISGPSKEVDNNSIEEKLIYEMKKEGIYTENIKNDIKEIKKINDNLISDATLYGKGELEDTLREIGFGEIIFSDYSAYYGNSYFITAKK